MKSFKEYSKLRESQEIEISETGDMPILFKLIRLAWRNHNAETRDFLRSLSGVNSEIASEFQRIEGGGAEKPKHKPEDADEVVPSAADGGGMM